MSKIPIKKAKEIEKEKEKQKKKKEKKAKVKELEKLKDDYFWADLLDKDKAKEKIKEKLIDIQDKL